MQGGEKNKKPEGGVFHRQNGCQKIRFYKCYDICFLNIYEQDHLRWRYSTVIHLKQLVYLAKWKDLNKGKI